MTATTILRRVTALLFGAILVTGILPDDAEAQSRLKRLKNAVRPDSTKRAEAALGDSVEKLAALAATASDGATSAVAPPKQSRLKRAVSATKKAANKVEDVTGISAKDAALMATGVGVGAIAAKKLGVDPTSISSRAMEAAGNVAQQRSATTQAKQSGAMMRGMPSAGSMDPAAMQEAMRAAQSRHETTPAMTGFGAVGTGMPGYSETDAKVMMVFQQEMMQVAMAASQGDAKAQARLEAWTAIAEKYEPEMQRLSLAAASAGGSDLKSIQRLHDLQLAMIKEWSRTSTPRVRRAKP